ncbi:unnamed protein product [Strongylus vulgaris]|uniref:Uncharacterized protein n=1 Tax=Strongylus vulgaris TaxID=40348 RepID=A0A3P7JJX9_STRVU|nr:unnamed protein product [Strongylus vulgaris]
MYALSLAAVVSNDKQSVISENQFDFSPQSISTDSIGEIGENTDMFMPAPINNEIYRYGLPNWRSPGYPMMTPYYGNMQYLNRFNLPMSRFGYVPLNRLPFAGQVGMYQRFNQYPFRSAYAPMPSGRFLL